LRDPPKGVVTEENRNRKKLDLGRGPYGRWDMILKSFGRDVKEGVEWDI
jgi:hypothetical protein